MAPLICKYCGDFVIELHRIDAYDNNNFCSLECVNRYLQNRDFCKMSPDELHTYYLMKHDGMIDILVREDGWCKIVYYPKYEHIRQLNNLPEFVEEQYL